MCLYIAACATQQLAAVVSKISTFPWPVAAQLIMCLAYCVVVSINTRATLLPPTAAAVPLPPLEPAVMVDLGRPLMVSTVRCSVVDTACTHTPSNTHNTYNGDFSVFCQLAADCAYGARLCMECPA